VGVAAEQADTSLLSSTEAYLLLYERDDAVDSAQTPVLPADLQQYVDEHNKSLMMRIAARSEAAAADASALETKRARVSDLLSRAQPPPSAPLCGSRWISSEWLTRWARDAKPPGTIDNSGLLCRHKRLDIEAVRDGKLRRINVGVWTDLLNEFGGAPELHGADALCVECLHELASAQRRRESLHAQVDAALTRGPPPGPWVWADKRWLTKWRVWGGAVAGAAALKDGPALHIACPHAALRPGATSHAVPISEEMWAALAEQAAAAASMAHAADTRKAALKAAAALDYICIDVDDVDAHVGVPPAVELDAPPLARLMPLKYSDGRACAACCSGSSEDKLHREAEHSALLRLSKHSDVHITPHDALVALPFAFLEAWRMFLAGSGPRPNPTCLDVSLLCAPHGLLIAQPAAPSLVRGKWVIVQPDKPKPVIQMVTDADARRLCSFYSRAVAQFPTATVAVAGENRLELSFGTHPCDECMASMAAAAAARASSFKDQTLTIELRRAPRSRGIGDGHAAGGAEPDGDDDEAAAVEGSDEDPRQCRRSARCSAEHGASAKKDQPTAAHISSPKTAASDAAKKASLAAIGRTFRAPPPFRFARDGRRPSNALTLYCCSSDLVMNLKARVNEATGEKIISLWLNGKELLNCSSLGAGGVTAGCRLFCAVGEGGDDAADFFPGSGRPAEAERGFAGTALLSAEAFRRGAPKEANEAAVTLSG
jgi:hypothetical protein